MMNEVLDYTM